MPLVGVNPLLNEHPTEDQLRAEILRLLPLRGSAQLSAAVAALSVSNEAQAAYEAAAALFSLVSPTHDQILAADTELRRHVRNDIDPFWVSWRWFRRKAGLPEEPSQ